MKNNDHSIRVGISIGDINGVGPEVVIKTFEDNRILQRFTPIVYASKNLFQSWIDQLAIEDFEFNSIENADIAKPNCLNVVNVWKESNTLKIGNATPEGGSYALKSLNAVTKDLAANKLDVLVTAPINKRTIQSDTFNFPGHTEYLAHMANTEKYMMLMVADELRLGVVTGHIPLDDVKKTIHSQLIFEKAELLNNCLKQDFGIVKPRIAILGLNPHAGDGGLIGQEEKEVILPAIQKLKESGVLAFGPYPADGFFGSDNFKNFDGILAMYHDQGLIPFKALTFGSGVNYTAGLPIVRTSPDHGTAYDVAGKNLASTASFRQACFLACDIYAQRKYIKSLISNPLKPRGERQIDA